MFPNSITLTWNIVVKFPNAETVENQLIELTFNINKNKEHKKTGNVILNISHTNQAWGIEVLNLLKDKIQNVLITKSRAAVIAYRGITILKSDMLIPVMMLLFVMLVSFKPTAIDLEVNALNNYTLAESIIHSKNINESLVATLAVREMNSENINKSSANLITSPELKEALKKIGQDHLAFEKKKGQFNLALTLIPLTIIFIGFYLAKLNEYLGASSHITITKRAELMLANEVAQKSKVEFYSLTFISVSIVLGILVNFLYQILSS